MLSTGTPYWFTNFNNKLIYKTMSASVVSGLNVPDEVKVSGTPTDGQTPVFNATTGMYEPANLDSAAGNVAPFADVASATTCAIGAAASENVRVTGTTTITGLGTVAAGVKRVVRFAAALTLTNNNTSLILPGGANITTAANDCAEFVSLGSGNWICTGYTKASGAAVAASGGDFTYVIKQADQTKTTNTTVAADNELTFTAVANATYEFECHIKYTGNNVVRLKAAFVVPSLASYQSNAGAIACDVKNLGTDVLANGAPVVMVAVEGTGGASGIQVLDTASGATIYFKGILPIGGIGGNVALYWAQNSSSATAATVKAGSFIKYKLVP